jgi:hypothetical protein
MDRVVSVSMSCPRNITPSSFPPPPMAESKKREEILAKEGVYPKLGVWPRRVLLSQIGSELIQRRIDPLPREYLAKIDVRRPPDLAVGCGRGGGREILVILHPHGGGAIRTERLEVLADPPPHVPEEVVQGAAAAAAAAAVSVATPLPRQLPKLFARGVPDPALDGPAKQPLEQVHDPPDHPQSVPVESHVVDVHGRVARRHGCVVGGTLVVVEGRECDGNMCRTRRGVETRVSRAPPREYRPSVIPSQRAFDG